MVMGVQWHNDLVGDHRREVVRIVNIDTFGQVVANPLEYVEDEAVEDNLFQEDDIDVFPGEKSENWEQCFLTLLFLTSIPSKTSFKDMGKCFSNLSIKKV
jgi:hypothetical protein